MLARVKEKVIHILYTYGHKAEAIAHCTYLGLVFVESHYAYSWVAGSMLVIIVVLNLIGGGE